MKRLKGVDTRKKEREEGGEGRKEQIPFPPLPLLSPTHQRH